MMLSVLLFSTCTEKAARVQEEELPEAEAALPSSAEEPSEKTPSSAELDFPDVHGEAEKIDVFGDDELS